jgi:crossover junction endodeoxyribonuclease RuvC
MRIIGIDPGSNITGYGIVELSGGGMRHIESGNIAPARGTPLPRRLLEICDGLSALIGRHRPDAAAIEDVFVSKNARSSLLLGHARGAAMIAACRAGLAVEEYQPSQVKQAVAGTGRATKEQMQLMVRAILRLPEVACEDASDALAVAICHANSQGLAGAIARGLAAGKAAG